MVAPRTLFLFLVYCQLLPSPSQLHHTLPSPDSMRNRMQLPNSRVMGMLIWFAERPHRAKQPTKIQLKGSAACYPGSTALCVSPSFGVSLSFTAWTLVGFHLALDFYFIFLAQVDNLLLLCFHAKMSLKITFSFSEVFAQHSAGLILLENTSWCSARQHGCEYVYPPGYPGGENSRQWPPGEKHFGKITLSEDHGVILPSDSLLHSGFCIYISSDATPVITWSCSSSLGTNWASRWL